MDLSSNRRQLEIIGHRGVAFDAPENTLVSVALAWEQGADGVEIDVHLSKDHEIIVMHDATTQRTTGVQGRIAELTLEEIRRLDAGSWKDARFQGEKVPTLGEVLDLIPDDKRLVVEFKAVGPHIVAKTRALLQQRNLHPDQLWFISYNYEILKEIGSIFPQYKTLPLREPPQAPHPSRGPISLEELIALATSAHMYGLNLHYGWLVDKTVVQRVHDAGLKLYVWTINDPDIACEVVRAGVDGISTDCTGFIREVLKRMV